jgi:biopolymer transport protein ExbD
LYNSGKASRRASQTITRLEQSLALSESRKVIDAEGPLASWDVFHGDRLELERGLNAGAIRAALARGELRDDDLVRPAGTTVAWARLAEFPELLQSADHAQPSASAAGPLGHAAAPSSIPSPSLTNDFEVQADEPEANLSLPPAPTTRAPDWLELGADPDDVTFPVIKDESEEPESRPRGTETSEPPPPDGWVWGEEAEDEDFDEEREAGEPAGASELEILDDDEPEIDIDTPAPLPSEPKEDDGSVSRLALPVIDSRGWDDIPEDAEAEDEAVVSLSRSGPATVEELDLAPMVDVAFQLVLFFMVTATTVLYKTLEIPKPSSEQAPTAVAQGRSLSDLQDDHILVEIDAGGGMKIDREPVPANMDTVVERLRSSREKTNRKAMLLSADFATLHRNTVLAFDAANEIGLRIVIARPANPQGPAPSLLAQPAQPPPRAAPPPGAVPN